MTDAVAFTDEFQLFLDGLKDPIAARAIKTRIVRFEAGLFGDAKSVGGKVMEARVDVGPGYRLYYTMKGRRWSCCFVAETRGASRPTSKRQRPGQRAWFNEGNEGHL